MSEYKISFRGRLKRAWKMLISGVGTGYGAEIEVSDERDRLIERLESEVAFLRSLLSPKQEMAVMGTTSDRIDVSDIKIPVNIPFAHARTLIEKKLRERHAENIARENKTREEKADA